MTTWFLYGIIIWADSEGIPNGQHLSESSDTFTDCFSENLQNEGALLSGNTITAFLLVLGLLLPEVSSLPIRLFGIRSNGRGGLSHWSFVLLIKMKYNNRRKVLAD